MRYWFRRYMLWGAVVGQPLLAVILLAFALAVFGSLGWLGNADLEDDFLLYPHLPMWLNELWGALYIGTLVMALTVGDLSPSSPGVWLYIQAALGAVVWAAFLALPITLLHWTIVRHKRGQAADQ